MTFDEFYGGVCRRNKENPNAARNTTIEDYCRQAFQAGAASRDGEIAELVAALETVIANAPEPYCAITRAVDAQCRAALAKVRKP